MRRITTGALALLAAITGCRSTGLTAPFGLLPDPAPAVLTPTATAAEVVAAVNANAGRVQTYQAPSASISMPASAGLPIVQASLAAERPLRFRMRATTALTGPEIDLGSNDERFWVWARRNEPPAVYTARHDLWATSPTRGQVPIEPAWLIDAIGLVQLDPAAPYVGPTPRGDGTLELRTQVAGPNGAQQRVFVIDSRTAWVREQHVYDAAGSLTASVFADRHEYDESTQVSLPHRVRLTLPAAGLNLTINTGPITTNAPVAGGAQLWSMPQIPEAPLVDLTNPGATPTAPAGPWDLAGVSTTYGASDPLATRFGDRASPPAGWRSVQETTSPSLPATADQPATPTYPVAGAIPARQGGAAAGFVGLPSGGRPLDALR